MFHVFFCAWGFRNFVLHASGFEYFGVFSWLLHAFGV